MRAALALLGATQPGAGGPAHRRHRRHAGARRRRRGDARAIWRDDWRATSVDLLFGAGPLMRALYEAAPAAMRGALGRALARHSSEPCSTALRGGDVVMVKGSNGSRMGPVVAALREHFSSAQARRVGNIRC